MLTCEYRLPSHEGSGLKYLMENGEHGDTRLPSHEGSGLKWMVLGNCGDEPASPLV